VTQYGRTFLDTRQRCFDIGPHRKWDSHLLVPAGNLIRLAREAESRKASAL
jgi:hypothetical protein